MHRKGWETPFHSFIPVLTVLIVLRNQPPNLQRNKKEVKIIYVKQNFFLIVYMAVKCFLKICFSCESRTVQKSCVPAAIVEVQDARRDRTNIYSL